MMPAEVTVDGGTHQTQHYAPRLACFSLTSANQRSSTRRWSDKDFDFLLMPSRPHGFGNDPYFVRRRWDYFERSRCPQLLLAAAKVSLAQSRVVAITNW